MNDIENTEETFSENDEIPLTKNKGGRPKKIQLPKEKKPRTDKQIEAQKKAFATRQANVEKRKLEKKIEASKLLLSLENNVMDNMKEQPQTGDIGDDEANSEEEEEDEEPQIQLTSKVIKKPKVNKTKPKSKGKKIIIYQEPDSDDSSSSSSESENEIKPKKFTTQRNKKSIVKIHQPETKPISKTEKIRFENFFTD
jgi:hypothetical protein